MLMYKCGIVDVDARCYEAVIYPYCLLISSVVMVVLRWLGGFGCMDNPKVVEVGGVCVEGRVGGGGLGGGQFFTG